MKRLVIAGMAVVAGINSACAHDLAAPGAPVSVSVTVAPAPGTTSVALNSAVTVTFGYPMDSASCVGRFAMHRGDTSGVAVPGRMTWDSTYRHMTFRPDSMMDPGTPYYVHMRDSMMTRDSMMSNSAMGMRGMGAMSGGQHLMPGSPMMFDQLPAGATRTSDGMRWSFTTSS